MSRICDRDARAKLSGNHALRGGRGVSRFLGGGGVLTTLSGGESCNLGDTAFRDRAIIGRIYDPPRG